MKAYLITPRWFDGERFVARSAAQAKYQAFKACREVLGRDITFADFLTGLSVLHLGKATP